MIQKELMNEIQGEKERMDRFRRRMIILGKEIVTESNERIFILRKRNKNLNSPSLKDLQKAYDSCCTELNKRWVNSIEKTVFEREITEKIKKETKLKFCQSHWIGGYNIDIFFPSLTGSTSILKDLGISRNLRMRGLAIEIDGPIHNQELKMMKDERKMKHLFQLDIGLICIENKDCNTPTVRNLIQNLNKIPRLDSRARRRVHEKKYVSTLAYYAEDDVLADLYGPKFIDLYTKQSHPNLNS